MQNVHHMLAVVCLLSIRGPCSLLCTAGATEMPLSSSVPPPEEYDDYDTVSQKVPSKVSPDVLRRCDFSPCEEGQIPCKDMAASTGCLCPGFTLEDEPPEAPELKSVSWNGSGVLVRWCRPFSFVTEYILKVNGQELRRFGEDQRTGLLGTTDNGANVCVVAMNDAGMSEESCMTYRHSGSSTALVIGLVGGALGVLLLILLAVLLWRRRGQRKQDTV